ncbi:PE family protein [Mycobacterium bohemicum DSM 44277]|uniref:PE family protein n=1 Tax=Mycobacterium bohemicum DSM 44277 TaxID=1236609 RepID=A0A0U0W3B9_MYCBE|nr:PE domain-containing protein [Mycobacterium bohemicum]CPR05383.1 PE family protein [Mycobacterium bohemicum DSM 44277]
MSFVTTRPDALLEAARALEGLGSSMAAQNATAAAPTTAVAPAAADEVSALQAALFSAYGNLYQSVSAQAAAIHQMLVNTLDTNARSYGLTEAVNQAATGAAPALPGLSSTDSVIGTPVGWLQNFPAAASDMFSLSPGFATSSGGAPAAGLATDVAAPALPTAVQSLASPVAAAAAPAQSILDPLSSIFNDSLVVNAGQAIFDTGAWNMFAAIAAGVVTQHIQAGAISAGARAPAGGGVLAGSGAPAGASAAPVSAGMGSASLVGKLSVPPVWSAATPAPQNASVLAGSGWSAPAVEGAQTTTLAGGMPAVASAGRSSGYAAGPRYGVTPKVMPTRLLV